MHTIHEPISPTNRRDDEPHYLSEKQLARRLNMSIKWCQKLRYTGGGIPYLKLGNGAVRYAIDAVEAYERDNLRAHTSSRPAEKGG